MKVWLIKISEPLPVGSGSRVLRTGMLGQRLAAHGHEVTWWTSAFGHYEKKMIYRDRERIPLAPGFTAIAIRGISYSRNVSLRRYIDHGIVAKRFRNYVSSHPIPDIVIAATPDYRLAAEAVDFANKNRIPVLVDIRDKWPDFFWEMAPSWLSPIVKTVLWHDRRTLARALARADGLVSVTTSWLEWGLALAGRSRGPWDTVFPLGASAPSARRAQSSSPRLREIRERAAGRFVVSFIGTFSRIHSPLAIVRAALKIKEHFSLSDRVLFILAGDGALRRQVESLCGNLSSVFLPGWLSAPEIDDLLSFSSVGVVPFGLRLDLFPNKAFTYLSAGLPVLSSDEGDLREWLKKYNAGGHFAWDNPGDLADWIERLALNPELYSEMRKNAQRLFTDHFQETQVYSNYVRHIESVVTSRTPRSGGSFRERVRAGGGTSLRFCGGTP